MDYTVDGRKSLETMDSDTGLSAKFSLDSENERLREKLKERDVQVTSLEEQKRN